MFGLMSGERASGYPKPELYNQHYINKYSFPKGLISTKKPEEVKKRNERLSLYDLDTPAVRKGISGWKLTKRPMDGITQDPLQLGVFPSGSVFDTQEQYPQEPAKRKKSKKRRGNSQRKDG